MNIRFDVNQAEALRKGVDCPKSIVSVNVDPSELTQEQRNLIADRMTGIDVYPLTWQSYDKDIHDRVWTLHQTMPRIQASLPTFDALMEAIKANDAEIKREELARTSSNGAAPDRAQKKDAAEIKIARVVIAPSPDNEVKTTRVRVVKSP